MQTLLVATLDSIYRNDPDAPHVNGFPVPFLLQDFVRNIARCSTGGHQDIVFVCQDLR